MGFTIEYFTESVDPDFICKICSDVSEDPVECSECQTLYCSMCINNWLNRSCKCPNCRTNHISVEKAHRIIRNQINNLQVKCRQGCEQVMKLEKLQEHEKLTCPNSKSNQSKVQEKLLYQENAILKKENDDLRQENDTLRAENQKLWAVTVQLANDHQQYQKTIDELKDQIRSQKEEIQNQQAKKKELQSEISMNLKKLDRANVGILKTDKWIYLGEIKDGKRHGFGVQKYKNTGCFECGEFINNTRYGRIGWIRNDGNQFNIKDVENDEIKGVVIEQQENGCVRRGFYKDKKFQGQVRIDRPDGSVTYDWGEVDVQIINKLIKETYQKTQQIQYEEYIYYGDNSPIIMTNNQSSFYMKGINGMKQCSDILSLKGDIVKKRGYSLG